MLYSLQRVCVQSRVWLSWGEPDSSWAAKRLVQPSMAWQSLWLHSRTSSLNTPSTTLCGRGEGGGGGVIAISVLKMNLVLTIKELLLLLD